MPSDLYRFMDKPSASAAVKVNGQAVPMTLAKGYVTIDRAWKAGDVVDINRSEPAFRSTI